MLFRLSQAVDITSEYRTGPSGAKLAYALATRALRALVEHVLALMSAADTVASAVK